MGPIDKKQTNKQTKKTQGVIGPRQLFGYPH